MGILDVFNSKKRFRDKLREHLKDLEITDKSNRERHKYKVQISGVEMDDLDPTGPPREIPFVRDVYKETKEEAIEIGKSEWELGNEVEVWKLVKRWN